MCKKSDTWIHPLADLGYESQLIEQKITLSKNAKEVKPDVVVASNKELNSIVFDCKGGKTVDTNQLERYDDMSTKDLARWVSVYDMNRLTHDVCLAIYEANHSWITAKNPTGFPILSFDKTQLRKTGNFNNNNVNKQFENVIKIDSSMREPLSYYPFSENEDKSVIIPHVLRAIVSILTNRKLSSKAALATNTFDDAEILRIVHKMFDILSMEHQNSLKETIHKIINEIRGTYPRFREQIDAMQTNQSASTVNLSNLITTCYDIIAEEEKKRRIDDFT